MNPSRKPFEQVKQIRATKGDICGGGGRGRGGGISGGIPEGVQQGKVHVAHLLVHLVVLGPPSSSGFSAAPLPFLLTPLCPLISVVWSVCVRERVGNLGLEMKKMRNEEKFFKRRFWGRQNLGPNEAAAASTARLSFFTLIPQRPYSVGAWAWVQTTKWASASLISLFP